VKVFVFCIFALFSCLLYAQGEVRWANDAAQQDRYLGRIEVNSLQSLQKVLSRADGYFKKNDFLRLPIPIHIILHGKEARVLVWENYKKHQELVDMAARLQALGVVKIEVCETWMRHSGVTKEALAPFVDTVPYGPSREQQLRDKGFLYF
jgi:intracellular sulfur oxidation DsrE/DsrF family protein